MKRTPPADGSIAAAVDFARSNGSDVLAPLHLLYGLRTVRGSFGSDVLTKAEVAPEDIRDALYAESAVGRGPVSVTMSGAATDVIASAEALARAAGHHFCGTEHLLLALVDEPTVHDFLHRYNLNVAQGRAAVLGSASVRYPERE